MASLLLDEYDPRLFKAKRQYLGLSQQDLADKCGMTAVTVNRIENNAQVSEVRGRGCRSKPYILLIGLVLDYIADEQGKLDGMYMIEKNRGSILHGA